MQLHAPATNQEVRDAINEALAVVEHQIGAVTTRVDEIEGDVGHALVMVNRDARVTGRGGQPGG